MKSHNFNLFIYGFFLIVSLGFGQSKNGLVEYTDIESLGAPGANLKAFNAVLYFTPEKSIYVTKVDSLENGGKKITKTYKKEDGSIQGIRSSSIPDGLFNINYRKENRLVSNARFKSNFTHREKLPEINWKITNETKKIEDVEVTKATAHFRGRNYTAWFASGIPVPLGPWKLHGLPGLILEAYDDDKEILFVFKKLEYPYIANVDIPDFNENLPDLEKLIEEQNQNLENNLDFQKAAAEQYQGSSTEGSNKKERLKRYLEIFE